MTDVERYFLLDYLTIHDDTKLIHPHRIAPLLEQLSTKPARSHRPRTLGLQKIDKPFLWEESLRIWGKAMDIPPGLINRHPAFFHIPLSLKEQRPMGEAAKVYYAEQAKIMETEGRAAVRAWSLPERLARDAWANKYFKRPPLHDLHLSPYHPSVLHYPAD